MLYFDDENKKVPEGYKKIDKKIILQNYLDMDLDNNFVVSKNEWMITFIKLLANDIESLEKEGPASIMGKIQELSDEFDKYDKNGNKYIEFKEFEEIVSNSLFISE